MYVQLQLPLFSDTENKCKHLIKYSTPRNKKSKNGMKHMKNQQESIIFDELLDDEIEKAEKQAWQWTLDVDKWIWKQIRDRRVPDHDWHDVYSLCVIEVFNLMKRYNPKYSKVSWANFGIMKAFKEYESMNGTVRLPFHVLEKMSNLRKFIKQQEQQGNIVTAEDMSKVTKMKLTDLLVARDRYAFIHSTDPEGNNTEFSSENLDVDTTCLDYVNSGGLDPEENAIENDQMNWLYKNLVCLSEVEIYVLCLRFGLNKDKVPQRKAFLKGMWSLTWHKTGECLKFNDIGNKIDITRERVRQIENRAIEKIRARIELEKRYER